MISTLPAPFQLCLPATFYAMKPAAGQDSGLNVDGQALKPVSQLV